MKVLFPRRFNPWFVAIVSLATVAFVAFFPAPRSRAANPTSYTIVDLGAFTPGTESKAFGINSCGQVAGYATTNGTSNKRPFFRPSNSLIDLGVLSGDGIATSLNNSGYVVGYSPTNGSTDRAFIWHDDNGNNASEPATEMKQILPDGAVGRAEDVNDNGRVAGWIFSDGGSGGTGGFAGFVWENNNFQLISGSPAHNSTKVYGINNAGTMVGEDSDTIRAFVLRNGVFTDIPPLPGGNKSVAYAVSEADHVVGGATINASTMHAFIWTDAGLNPGLKDLGTLTGKTRSEAYNIAIVNGSEVRVVGTSYSNPDLSDARAFVWQDANGDGDGNGVEDAGEMKDLTTLISDSSWTVLQQARAINSSGQIVGFGLKSTGETHAFLLTPTGVSPSPCLPTVNVTVSPSAVNEDAASSLTYTFTRSIVTGSPLTVNFSTGGTAVANDYAISAVSTIQIPANQMSATVTVTPMADLVDEPNETVILTVSPDVLNYTVGAQNPATGTITDDDATPTIQITNVTAAEPSPGPSNFVFTVSLTNPSSSQITVNYATDTTGATATGGASCGGSVDFVNVPTTLLTFAAGETSKQVNVQVCGDNDVEPDETFFVTLSGNSPNSVLAGIPKGTGTITNDDSLPSVSVAVAPSSTAEDSATNLVYTFSRTGVTTGALTLNFSVSGTATLNNDYSQSGAATFGASAGTVTLLANSSSATVTLDPTADTTVESDETVVLAITANAAYTIGSPGSATGTITNDDPTPTVQITNVTAAEPSPGPSNFVFTVSLTNPSSSPITVNYATDTTGATATGGASCGGTVDFVNVPTTLLTFAAGETSKQVNVSVCGDSILEGDETFFVTLSGNSPNSVLAGTPKGTGTITPQTPTIFVEQGTEGNPIPTAAAVDSVTFLRGPFRLTNNNNLTPSDSATRIIIFTSPLGMTAPNLASGILSVHFNGSPVALANIEHVGPVTGVPGLNASYIIVKLPATLPNPSPGPNNVTLTVKMGSAASNTTIVSIVP